MLKKIATAAAAAFVALIVVGPDTRPATATPFRYLPAKLSGDVNPDILLARSRGSRGYGNRYWYYGRGGYGGNRYAHRGIDNSYYGRRAYSYGSSRYKRPYPYYRNYGHNGGHRYHDYYYGGYGYPWWGYGGVGLGYSLGYGGYGSYDDDYVVTMIITVATAMTTIPAAALI